MSLDRNFDVLFDPVLVNVPLPEAIKALVRLIDFRPWGHAVDPGEADYSVISAGVIVPCLSRRFNGV
jgi:hypothetical protein